MKPVGSGGRRATRTERPVNAAVGESESRVERFGAAGVSLNLFARWSQRASAPNPVTQNAVLLMAVAGTGPTHSMGAFVVRNRERVARKFAQVICVRQHEWPHTETGEQEHCDGRDCGTRARAKKHPFEPIDRPAGSQGPLHAYPAV